MPPPLSLMVPAHYYYYCSTVPKEPGQTTDSPLPPPHSSSLHCRLTDLATQCPIAPSVVMELAGESPVGPALGGGRGQHRYGSPVSQLGYLPNHPAARTRAGGGGTDWQRLAKNRLAKNAGGGGGQTLATTGNTSETFLSHGNVLEDCGSAWSVACFKSSLSGLPRGRGLPQIMKRLDLFCSNFWTFIRVFGGASFTDIHALSLCGIPCCSSNRTSRFFAFDVNPKIMK